MSYSEYIPFQQNHQSWNANAQASGLGGSGAQGGQGWGYGPGLGQAAFGQQGYGGPGGWQQGQWGGNPWQQRQLGPHEVGEVVRQLFPILSQIVGQAQQPQAAFGYGGFGGHQGFGGAGGYGGGSGQWGGGGRQLSQQDVNEVVRQILPVIPQIVNLLQGQQQHPLANAIYGGGGGGWHPGQILGQLAGQGGFGGQGYGQGGFGQGGFGQGGFGQGGYGQGPLGQAAFGGGAGGQQRQLNQAEVGEIVRHLVAALPQVIANLQAFNQQQQRAA